MTFLCSETDGVDGVVQIRLSAHVIKHLDRRHPVDADFVIGMIGAALVLDGNLHHFGDDLREPVHSGRLQRIGVIA